MRIEVDKLEEQGGEFSRIYGIDELPLGETDVKLRAPVVVRGRARRKANEINLTGRIETEVETICSRCLKSVKLPVRAGFSERFVSEVSWRNEEQHELKSEDLDLAVLGGEAIDVDELVREEILLALPVQVLCHEDCKGLCAVCGCDRNLVTCTCEPGQIDSRWEKLKELRIE